MHIETGLLLLESVLLIATIILLAYSIREGKQRDRLLSEMSKTTKILTRQEYFLTVLDSMIGAKEEVIGSITGRMPAAEDRPMVRDIISTIEGLVKRGVRVRYLLPKFPDRLHIGFHYSKAGADVQYSTCLMVHNVRFMTVDDRVVVLGIPEIIGEAEATRKGYRIPSEGLAMVLRNYYDSCGKKTGFADYVKEVMAQTGATLQNLSREYHIDEEELKRMVG